MFGSCLGPHHYEASISLFTLAVRAVIVSTGSRVGIKQSKNVYRMLLRGEYFRYSFTSDCYETLTLETPVKKW